MTFEEQLLFFGKLSLTYTYKLQNLDESLCTRVVGWVGKGRCTWNLG